jgi:hypothetical protein
MTGEVPPREMNVFRKAALQLAPPVLLGRVSSKIIDTMDPA